jgi:hypothetical protein
MIRRPLLPRLERTMPVVVRGIGAQQILQVTSALDRALGA